VIDINNSQWGREVNIKSYNTTLDTNIVVSAETWDSVKIDLELNEDFFDRFKQLKTFVNGMQIHRWKINEHKVTLIDFDFDTLQWILMKNSPLMWWKHPTYFLALFEVIEEKVSSEDNLKALAMEKVLRQWVLWLDNIDIVLWDDD